MKFYNLDAIISVDYWVNSKLGRRAFEIQGARFKDSRGRTSEVLIFDAGSGVPSVEVRLDDETVWLTQEQISLLFDRERSVVTKHLRNGFTPI